MKTVAQQLGLDFVEKDEWGHISLLEGFSLFKRGGNKKIHNLISQRSALGELKVQIFDYQYTISTGKSMVTPRQTVFFVQSKALALPEFWMKPEHIFHKIGNWLGIRDINFEEHPVFSNQYHLRGEDENLVRNVFSEDVLHFFTIERNWCLEGVGYFFVLYQNSKLIKPEAIPDFYRKGMEVLNRLNA